MQITNVVINLLANEEGRNIFKYWLGATDVYEVSQAINQIIKCNRYIYKI